VHSLTSSTKISIPHSTCKLVHVLQVSKLLIQKSTLLLLMQKKKDRLIFFVIVCFS